MFETIIYKKDETMKPGILYKASNGTFRQVSNTLYDAIVKIDIEDNDNELEQTIQKIKIPKIPYNMFMRVYSFFKSIYQDIKTEVAVLLWYNVKDNVWRVEVPEQKTSGASVDYERDEELNNRLSTEGFICVGTIHSHCEMSAFHSGTDDKDEYNFDGVHITIGKVLTGPEFAQRFIVKDMEHKFDTIYEVVDFPIDTVEFPEEWSSQVSKNKYTNGTLSNYGFGAYGGNPKYKETVVGWEEQFNKADEQRELQAEALELLPKKGDKYECPLCEKLTRVKRSFKCTHCGFPLADDVSDYELKTTRKGGYAKSLEYDLY